MSTLETEKREYLENLAFEKSELYNEHLKELDRQQDSDECENILIAYMGLDDFKNLSENNISDIIDAMKEYTENKINK